MTAPGDPNKRKRTNLVIALSLLAFVILVFIVTMTRLGGHAIGGGM